MGSETEGAGLGLVLALGPALGLGLVALADICGEGWGFVKCWSFHLGLIIRQYATSLYAPL